MKKIFDLYKLKHTLDNDLLDMYTIISRESKLKIEDIDYIYDIIVKVAKFNGDLLNEVANKKQE